MIRLEMKKCNMVLTERLQNQHQHHYIIIRKIDKYEYLTDQETLPPNQIRITEEAKFTYLLLVRDFEKQ